MCVWFYCSTCVTFIAWVRGTINDHACNKFQFCGEPNCYGTTFIVEHLWGNWTHGADIRAIKIIFVVENDHGDPNYNGAACIAKWPW